MLFPRKGREKQKYDGETRLVVGYGKEEQITTRCVAIRNHAILLVSSHNSADKWVLPKGGWEIDESEEDAAKRETFEEAGVGPVIIFEYRSRGIWENAFPSTRT